MLVVVSSSLTTSVGCSLVANTRLMMLEPKRDLVNLGSSSLAGIVGGGVAGTAVKAIDGRRAAEILRGTCTKENQVEAHLEEVPNFFE